MLERIMRDSNSESEMSFLKRDCCYYYDVHRSARKGSVSYVPSPGRARAASGAPFRSALIPCSDDSFVVLTLISNHS
jgi:hypothetical protein